ncbi:cytochrome o ubiquinol oxidase operon protein cyoD [Paenibacillus algorifonticola]|uniref:Cytochrome o ubiquinol oxidase operon protein cyoD n=1 Tax=Paenibacillus algorifonticola TaxID=684063 RepID=A0A1I2H5P0_9BACL|nr:cytochrome o ubiquinol oxidase subunit IV [Paenibacillus algorifonticola]SFF25002.1 cytochrome o ubiquinol oxidase operon protein cyoD [Paenibacillus algorifonticola]
MENHNSHSPSHDSHGSMKSYVIGFVLSIILTIIPIAIVMNDMLSKQLTIIVILIMAGLQFVVQLFFFMHLKDEAKPRYNTMALVFGLIILLTVVAGSIWIMSYNVVG